MATILNTSINLSKVPKNEIIDGKKGKYLPVTITINDEIDQFGQQGSLTVRQSKEQRESKEPKILPVCLGSALEELHEMVENHN